MDGTTQQPQTIAPKFKPFGNWITMSICTTVTVLMVGGVIMCFFSLWPGFIAAFIGAYGFAFGLKKHSPSMPRVAGIITIWDRILKGEKEAVIVGGTTIVAPYWPFKLDTIEIIMDNQDHVFERIRIISKDEVPMEEGEVHVILHPNITDLEDYIQAGNDKNAIREQIHDAVIAETQNIAKKHEALDISQSGTIVSDELHERIENGLFFQKKLGIKLIAVRVQFILPESVRKNLEAVRNERYQREAEIIDSATITKIARRMQREDAIQYIPAYNGKEFDDLKSTDLVVIDREISKPNGLLKRKRVFPFEHYRTKAERRRLIREGNVTVVEGTAANIGTFNANPKK